VTEFCSRGSLRGILDQPDCIDIPVKLGVKFAWDACKGMEFLHTLEPARLHRDLKAENILVSDDWTVKITDFGSARLLNVEPNNEWVMLPSSALTSPNRRRTASVSASAGGAQSPAAASDDLESEDEDCALLPVASSMSVDVGTLMWLAPEVMSSPDNSRNTTVYGPSADVYSYGILMFEILSRDMPYLNMHDMDIMMMSRFTFKHKVQKGLRPRIDTTNGYPMWYCELMEAAWSPDPQARPTFSRIGRQFCDDAGGEVDGPVGYEPVSSRGSIQDAGSRTI